MSTEVSTEATYVRGSRDPFARTELWKRRERGASCAWCGAPDVPVYRFEVHSDGGRVSPDRKTFCSRSCRDAFGD